MIPEDTRSPGERRHSLIHGVIRLIHGVIGFVSRNVASVNGECPSQCRNVGLCLLSVSEFVLAFSIGGSKKKPGLKLKVEGANQNGKPQPGHNQ